MKRLAAQRSGDRAIGTDQPQIEAQLLRDGQRKGMPPAGDQHDFDAGRMRLSQGRQIALGDLILRIKQRAVNVGGQQPDGGRRNRHSWNLSSMEEVEKGTLVILAVGSGTRLKGMRALLPGQLWPRETRAARDASDNRAW